MLARSRLVTLRPLLRRHMGARGMADYAVAPYRQMAWATDAERERWAAADATLHARMHSVVPAALQHNGEEEFAQHLVGVQSVLRSWGAEEHLTNAALFHSIYGTEGFQGYKLPLTQRAEIAELIGARAERLAFIFCMVDRFTVDQTVLGPTAKPPHEYLETPPTFYARAELGAFPLPLKSHGEWIDFLTLSLADWLEQVEGSAVKEVRLPVGDGFVYKMGEAWAYRRTAYKRMAEVLGEHGVDAAPRMYEEVFGREPDWSRAIIKPKTPPMGQAALDALEAMESAKLDFGDGAFVVEP